MLLNLLNLLGHNRHDSVQTKAQLSTFCRRSSDKSYSSRNRYDPEDRGPTIEDKLDSVAQTVRKRQRGRNQQS